VEFERRVADGTVKPGLRTMLDLPPIARAVNFAEEDRSVELKTF
jgi:hypothetical protein